MSRAVPFFASPLLRPVDSPRRSRMAAISSLLRIPEAPSTPISLARARSSGRTKLVREPRPSLEAFPPELWAAGTSGAFFAAGALGSAGALASGVKAFGSSPVSALPPDEMRSVSVTDFLSSLADQVTRGFHTSSRTAERGGHTIATRNGDHQVSPKRQNVSTQI